MDNLIKTMMQLIRCEITREPLPATIAGLSDDALKRLYRLSKAHDLVHLVGATLDENHLLPENDPITEKFRNQTMLAVYRYEQINFELDQIQKVLEEAKIPFIPLKGSVLRQYYPEPWMRTSCDIDILIHEENLQTATNRLVEKQNYRISEKDKGRHDWWLFSQSGVHLELHFGLVEPGRAKYSNEILDHVWDYTERRSEQEEYHLYLTDPMFYFYHISHMAKHFEVGGCGVRPLIDLWVLNHRIPHDEEQRRTLLEKGGLRTFERAMVNLSESWFSDAETDDLTEVTQDFILSGGAFGNVENRVAAQQQKKGGKFRYILSRIFLPYEIMRLQYPILRKHKWLLPLMEVRRWFRHIFGGGLKRSAKEVKINRSIEKDQLDRTAEMMERLGL